MLGLAQFIVKGPTQAALVISAFALLAFIVPPLGVISGAALTLVTLRNSAPVTATVVLLSLAASAGLAWAAGLHLMGTAPVGFWLMIAVVAGVLRSSENLAVAVFAALMLIVIALLLFFAIEPDPAQVWERLLMRMLEMPELGLTLSEQQIRQGATLMSGAVASTVLLGIVASVLVGRWWQSRLANSDSFRREFRQLRLGRILATVALLLLVAASVADSPLLIGLSAPTLVVYLFQGLAVMHALLARRSTGTWWLPLFYILLVFFPQLIVLVSLWGISDTWIDFRRRWITGGSA